MPVPEQPVPNSQLSLPNEMAYSHDSHDTYDDLRRDRRRCRNVVALTAVVASAIGLFVGSLMPSDEPEHQQGPYDDRAASAASESREPYLSSDIDGQAHAYKSVLIHYVQFGGGASP